MISMMNESRRSNFIDIAIAFVQLYITESTCLFFAMLKTFWEIAAKIMFGFCQF
jgi:hypothetical protein